MKITMLRRDIWLGGQTNTAYREGKTYDVPKARRDYFVRRESAVDAEPAPKARRGRRDFLADATGVEMQPADGPVVGDGSGHPLPEVGWPREERADAPAPRDD